MIETTIMAQVTGRGYRVTWPDKYPVRQQTITVQIGDEELVLPVSNEAGRAYDRGEHVKIVITVVQ